MTRARALFVLVAFALAPAVGRAQAAPSERPVRWAEVERGFYATGTFGVGILPNPPAADGEGPALSGLAMGVAAGVDLGSRLQVEAFLTGVQFSAPASYGGLGGPADPRGDFSSLLVGGKLRVAFLTLADFQNTDRLFLSVQGGGGVLLSEPSTVILERRPVVLGGVGLRYYTRMRHFAVGIDLDGAYAMDLESLLILPQASLSYTF